MSFEMRYKSCRSSTILDSFCIEIISACSEFGKNFLNGTKFKFYSCVNMANALSKLRRNFSDWKLEGFYVLRVRKLSVSSRIYTYTFCILYELEKPGEFVRILSLQYCACLCEFKANSCGMQFYRIHEYTKTMGAFIFDCVYIYQCNVVAQLYRCALICSIW